MKQLIRVMWLAFASVACGAAAGCVYVPERHYYAHAWVPGHWAGYYRDVWVPGHYR